MSGKLLFTWQYLIFLLPLGLSALLLILSSLRLGHRGGHGAHGHSAGHGGGLRLAHGHGHAGAAQSGLKAAHGPQVRARLGKVEVTRHGPNKENVTVSANLVLHLLGADRAPLTLVLEAFFLAWGVCGYWANQFTLQTGEPTARQMLPALGIALAGGLIGARVGAEIIARVMPQDESQDVSQEGLYGLAGIVAFPVSATGGRIHLYDEHGTLHDERCRSAPGHEPIAKGRRALVVDRDAEGNLLVEEVPEGTR